MYSTIPEEWRKDFDVNVTIEELNARLVELHIPTIVFLSILMFVGVLGNSLVLWIYVNYKASTYKSFIIWLACMDLLACLVGKPALIVSLLYPYISPSEGLCRWSRFLHVFISVSAAFIFLAISLERYRKICFLDMHQLSNKKVNIICLFAAILACLVAIPALFVFGDANVDTGVYNITGKECFIDQTYKNALFPQLYFLFQLVLCLISFIVMCVFYIRIWKTLRWHRTFVKEHTFTSKPNGVNTIGKQQRDKTLKGSTDDLLLQELKTQLKRDVDLDDVGSIYSDSPNASVKVLAGSRDLLNGCRSTGSRFGSQECVATSVNLRKDVENAQNLHTREITKMLFIVTVVFILAFLPHLILMITNALRPRMLSELTPAGVIVYNIFLRTFVINNMANPIVYFVCLQSFRRRCFEKFENIVKCCKRTKT